MKAKNVIFRLLAVIFAVGGAVASVNASLGINDVHLSYVTIGGTGFCSTIAPNPCTVSGSQICRVDIRVNNVPTVVTGWQHKTTAGACDVRYTRPNATVTPILVNKVIPPGATILN
ncbi:DUF6520 family protein [Dawidia soli]|uniref:Uncharacterized protein n=1 Tax=Dawidia soli TaxID=2782352 RepID=A0AAP2DH21_9BACT|nr:DUF6520 family protein [Dawidia soli]MBT1689232.1 hypothetical protein [Dawidia soli]